MPLAICISCGFAKKRPFAKCGRCGYSPAGDRPAMAKSLMVSTDWRTDDGEPRASRQELLHIGAEIERGVPPAFNPLALADLIAEADQTGWDAPVGVSPLRLVLLLLSIAAIPTALFVIGWLIGRLPHSR